MPHEVAQFRAKGKLSGGAQGRGAAAQGEFKPERAHPGVPRAPRRM